MKSDAGNPAWQRRARPLLGTLVEIGVRSAPGEHRAAFDAAFAAVFEVQQCLSRFDADSDVSRFHALRCGQALSMRPATNTVLTAARELQLASDGMFDISLGTAPQGWRCDGDELHKLSANTRLDAGGIAKGHAVDVAVQVLIDHGCAAGWVNAGGDLRVYGGVGVPVHVRDEATGGVRLFATLQDCAFATSHFDYGSRSKLVLGPDARRTRAHVSVAAPQCLWADALTKVVAIRGNTFDPLLAHYDATAWKH